MTWKVEARPGWYCIYDEMGWYVAGCQSERQAQLIANAPKTLAALEEIAEGAIVSPDQSPEMIAEQVLRVLRLARESAAEYMIYAGKQQERAERAEAALESIRDTAECFLQPLPAICTSRERWEVVRDRAVTAIAAVKGEDSEVELV